MVLRSLVILFTFPWDVSTYSRCRCVLGGQCFVLCSCHPSPSAAKELESWPFHSNRLPSFGAVYLHCFLGSNWFTCFLSTQNEVWILVSEYIPWLCPPDLIFCYLSGYSQRILMSECSKENFSSVWFFSRFEMVNYVE